MLDKSFGSSPIPEMRLLLDPIDDHAVTRLHTIKNTAVAVIPMAQAPIMIKEFKPLCSPLFVGPAEAAATPSHQSSKEEHAGLGARCCNPTDFIM
jgi:hypothetical protein